MPERFRKKDFRRREKLRPDYRLVSSSLLELLDFDSVFDIGCANGFLLIEFSHAGKRIGGIEKSPAVRAVLPSDLQEHVSIGDFRDAAGEWELVCCVEIAEHIEPERSTELVRTVTRLARRWIYFTAAPPGQKGHGHINCRPHEEWLDEFRRHGWVSDAARTRRVRADLQRVTMAKWLTGNSMILHPDRSASE